MQMVSNGDNLHDLSIPIIWTKNKKNIVNLLSASLAQKVVKVNPFIIEFLKWILPSLIMYMSPDAKRRCSLKQ